MGGAYTWVSNSTCGHCIMEHFFASGVLYAFTMVEPKTKTRRYYL